MLLFYCFVDETNSEKLEQMACWVYAATLSHLPACARQWWSGSDVKTSQLVERVTSTFVSPHLSLQELQYVATHENKFRNMTVNFSIKYQIKKKI